MRHTRIAGPGDSSGPCPHGVTCATVFETDRGTAVVQGYVLAAAELEQMRLPDGEYAVEIPTWILKEAARALRD